MHWLLVALEEAGTGWLLGLYQLLQALQHCQTQGLKPGGRHSQVDSLTLQGTGSGEQSEGATDAWARRHTALDWLISATTCLLPTRGKKEEPVPYPAGPLAARSSQIGLQTLLCFKAVCCCFYSKDCLVQTGAYWSG
mgnify:FL=1